MRYISQDFGQYQGEGDRRGLQTGKWDVSKIDLVCDIAAIPESSGSFDAILCTEVFEHLPDPLRALGECSRLLRSGGELILTAPFCSLTHFAPYHFSSGFNRYFYETHLPANGFDVLELQPNGNYFEYLAQEIRRVPSMAQRYARKAPGKADRVAMLMVLRLLRSLSNMDGGSEEVLVFGYHVRAVKKLLVQ